MNKIKYSLIVFAIILLGCNPQIKFDKTKWNEQPDIALAPPYRKQMLNDLTTNYKLVGLKYAEIISLLGTPNYSDSMSFCYDIEIRYDMIDPYYVKNLEFVFNKDSIITSFKIQEWKKK